MTEPGSTEKAGAGRRASVSRGRRIDLLVALAIAAPAVVALSVGVIGGEDNPLSGPQPPTTSALTSATMVCPGGLTGDDGAVRVTRTPDVPGGRLAVATAPAARGASGSSTTKAGKPVTVEQGSTVEVPSSTGPTVLDGRGAAAPGIAAGRDGELAVPECRGPSYDEWLVGVGASARYATTIELVNPDDGDAVVDLALHDATGPVEEPALRGIEVPPHGVKRIDLATAAPRAEATAAHLTVVRGRVTATARNTWDPLGRGVVSTDFLPADTSPSSSSLILGVPKKPAQPTLQLANPGDDEVRVAVRFVTEQAAFTPTGAPEISVPPQAIETVDLTKLFKGATADGVVGIELEASGPVASSFMALSGDDLVLLAPTPSLDEPAAAVVPSGRKSVVLGGAERTAVVDVVSYDAAGKEIRADKVEIGTDRGATLSLPDDAASISVVSRNTRIQAVVLAATGGRRPGLATLRVRPAELRAEIPVVEPD
ncbi:hypothetical protein CFH99_18235 [Nocardioides aromaticivorans]|uniref:Secreted protein n=1 Tax=Nocardioides aromaticivorans TaxID=200618 RepID=A0ABX7PPK7_9ACTN|nr:DUF5719 family protein [Nocardioides aromaticivorans]QSR27565.1 hypothetical protein CFH99_18235 [Nocardioides aromaticivorans]